MDKEPTTFRPIGNRILVKLDEADTFSKGGLYIPENAREAQRQGVVVSVGTTEYGLKAGDRVIFGKFAGQEIGIDGEPMLIIQEGDIFAVIE